MIFSSADILRILGKNEVIRLSAKISVVDSKPALSGREGIYIYVNRFPTLQEFEATWQIWIESDEEDDLIIAELRRILPSVQVTRGLMTTVSTTEFRSESTQRAPEVPRQAQAQVDPTQYEERFQELVDDIQDRMLLVTSGRAGKDGRDGVDGKDGRDGRDIVATEADLEDLQNVSQGIAKEKGQVLTWDGVQWTNLYIPTRSGGGGGGGAGGGVEPGAPSTTIQWKYHVGVGEPPARDFHTDNEADPTLVTILHVSNENNAGTNVASLLNGLLPNTDKIYLFKVNEPSSAHLYSVSGYTPTASGIEITVSHVETPGGEPALVNNSIYGFTFITAGGGGSGISDAPADNLPYVRYNNTWIDLQAGLDIIAGIADIVDGGDADQVLSTTDDSTTYDGGDAETATSVAADSAVLDGGLAEADVNTVLDGGLATV